jgi:hypothetical protein
MSLINIDQLMSQMIQNIPRNMINNNNRISNVINSISTNFSSLIQPDSPRDKKSFDKNLFITLDRLTHGSEFYDSCKCVICNYLSINPQYTLCCDQVICGLCAYEWKEKNQSDLICPHCKLKNFNYLPMTKFMTRVFNSLKIICKFEGCKEKFVPYDKILEHEKYCDFNPDGIVACDKCKIYYEKSKKEIHDCIKELRNSYEKMQEELKLLKTRQENEKGDQMIKDLKHSLTLHQHPLINVVKPEKWKCSTCGKSQANNAMTFGCFSCNVEICTKCFNLSYKECKK